MPPPMQHTITAQMLERVGLSLYGNNWKMPLARDLEISDRSLHYMVTGERGIHDGIVRDLLAIVERHEAELHEVAKELRRALR